MDSDDGFATRVNSVEELPEPFRGALLERLSPRESIQLLAFRPSRPSRGVRSPAMLLALTVVRWLVVSDNTDERVDIVECTFDDTLLMELMEILFQGRLTIDFVCAGAAQSCAIEFNTVTGKLYRDAVRQILRGVEGLTAAAPFNGPGAVPPIEMRAIVFRNAVPKALAEGRCPVAAVQWQAVFGHYGREVAPAAALLTTDRELVFISEKRMGLRSHRHARYGYVATYLPLARLAGFCLKDIAMCIMLDLDIRARHGGKSLQAAFPRHREQEVRQVLECAMRQAARLSTTLAVNSAAGNRSST